MATARDKLIADWQDRLAAAEAADLTSPGRPAWLARLQIRLYRFLLSLYGDGDWTTTPPRRPARAIDTESADGSVVFDSPTALPLAGKPAKSIGQIQSVLKTVASAQSNPPPSGPLMDGLPPESWVTAALAATKNWSRINRVAEALHKRGIATRQQLHGSRYVLEVRASDLQEAVRIARDLPRRPAPQRVVVTRQSEPGPFAPYFVHVIVIGAVVGLFTGQLALIWAHSALLGLDQRARLLDYAEPALWASFLVGWLLGATLTMAIASSLNLFLVAGRDHCEQRQESAAQFFAGLGWHCVAAGVLVAPFIGLLVVAIAERFEPQNDMALFFTAWAITTLAAGVIHVSRTS